MNDHSVQFLTEHCRVYPADQVTSINAAAEVDPRLAELELRDVAAIWRAVLRLYRSGLHPAIALCLRRRGKVVLDRAIGHLRGNAPGAPGAREPDAAASTATPTPIRYDSRFNLFSASKCVTAVLAHMLEDRRLVHLDDPVAEYVPEFGRFGKERVTIRQILSHRAGIPTLRSVAGDLDLLARRDVLMHHLYELRPLAPPGRRLAYHALTGGFVIDELVRRVTGKDIQAFLDETVRRPLGLSGFTYGVAAADLPLVAENAFTGFAPTPPYTWLLERALGAPPRQAVAISNDPRFLTTPVPSGNLISSADEACRFFEMLLAGGELHGVRVVERKTVRRAVAETSWLELDTFLAFPIRYSSGFMLGGRVVSLYGLDTDEAFGHLGFTNVLAWADPARDLSACLMTTGKPLATPGQVLWWNVMRTIASRVGKVRPRRA